MGEARLPYLNQPVEKFFKGWNPRYDLTVKLVPARTQTKFVYRNARRARGAN
jgi:hypothetical protein